MKTQINSAAQLDVTLHEILTRKVVEFTGPQDMDPTASNFDGNGPFSINMVLRAVGGFAARQAARSLGILSLSERWDSGLMWSHYAQSYRGLLLGFDATHPFLSGHDSPAMRESLHMMVEGFSAVATGPSVWPVLYINDRVPHVPNIHATPVITYADCLFKSSDWAYEREWRAFRSFELRDAIGVRKRGVFKPHITDNRDEFGNPVVLYEFPPEAIKEVVIGTFMSREDCSSLADIVENDTSLAHVELSTIHLSVDGYSLEKLRVTSGQLRGTGRTDATTSYEDQLCAEFRACLRKIAPDLLRKLREMLQSGAIIPLFGVEDLIFKNVLEEMINSSSDSSEPTR